MSGDAGLVMGGGDALIPIAVNATAHVPTRNNFDPFAAAGYTREAFLTEIGGANALDLGGGFNYWFRDDRAWTVSLRVVRPRFSSQYWLVGLGMKFR